MKVRLVVVGAVLFLAGAGIASLFWYYHLNAAVATVANDTVPIRQTDNSYHFINPLLAYDNPGIASEFNQYAPLVNELNGAVANAKANGVQNVGVYFRDLSLGRWMGFNENTGFAPGSMMKTIIMIAYFKEAESNPGILTQSFVYSSATADELNGIPFEAPSSLVVGQSYSAEQLIEAMIESSDNGAKNILLNNISQSNLADVYTDLSLPYLDPNQNYANYFISPKQYSLILRVLYNATYLNRADSEKALAIMTKATYKDGLVAGLPTGTTAAQKFGESVVATADSAATMVTLSNCGIIYYPNHPYLLCVMAQGGNAGVLTKAIASISQAVWNGVDKYVVAR